jgi:hypothetical protein
MAADARITPGDAKIFSPSCGRVHDPADGRLEKAVGGR